MTHHDRIKAIIWTPAAITVAIVAAYWCGTDRVSWVGMVLCGVVVAVCGVMERITERSWERMSRVALKKARQNAGMTQQQVADQLEISLRYYQNIEQGSRTGDFELWDSLEDLFKVHQRVLRENHRDKANSR